MFMWMSSSASAKGKRPASISAAIASRPARIACSSSASMRPIRASIAACASEPRMSWRHILRSKPIEALISCMITDGPAANRPPHCLFACAVAALRRFAQVRSLTSVAGSLTSGRQPEMQLMSRRLVLAAAGTLAMAAVPRKPRAQDAGGSGLGDLSALVPTDPPKPLPEITFVDARRDRAPSRGIPRPRHGGEPLGDVVRALRRRDAGARRLGQDAGADDIAVLPLSSDRGGAAAVRKFYEAHEIGSLAGAARPARAPRPVPGACAASRPRSSSTSRVANAPAWKVPPIGRRPRRRRRCGR